MCKISNYFRNIILALLFLLSLVITITNLFIDASMAFETTSYIYTQALFSLSNFFAILAILIMLISTIKLNFSFKTQHIILSILVLFTAISLWIIFNPEKPIDSYDIYYYANQWSTQGSPSEQYYAYYPYQFGLIHLVKILIDLFHDESVVTTIFRSINLVGLLITANILLDFTKDLTQSKKCTFLFILLWSTFFVPYFLVTFMYGDVIGMTFGCLAVWFYHKFENEQKLALFLLSLITLLIGIYFRLNTSIFGIALVLYTLFSGKVTHQKILMTISFGIITVIGLNIGDLILTYVYGLDVYQTPMIARLAMGFDANGAGTREPGWFNGYIVTMADNFGNDLDAFSHQAVIDLLASFDTFFHSPSYFLNFIGRKFASMIVLPDFEGFLLNFIKAESQWHIFNITIHGSYFIYWFNLISKTAFVLITIGSTIGLIINRNSKNNLFVLLSLIVLGGFTYHILFEAKARYVIPYILLLIPISVLGFKLLYKNHRISNIRDCINHKKALVLSCIFICIALTIYSFHNTVLPTVYFEGYTDTQVTKALSSGSYYSYPVNINDSIDITNVSILTYSENLPDNYAVVQLDIFDQENNVVKSTTLPARQLLNQSWTVFSFDPLHLNPGIYKFQFTSNNPSNENFGIILGNQYTYINEDNVYLNGFDTQLQGNIKVYKNH